MGIDSFILLKIILYYELFRSTDTYMFEENSFFIKPIRVNLVS